MRLIRSPRQMAGLALRWRRAGKRIGLVPTMGALHEGHLSLIRRSVVENDVTIVTVFVNPLQFGPREDVARYPRTLPRDLRFCRVAGADMVFAPTTLYPPGFQTSVEPGALATRWEGKHRPGHFRGVATVVAILFNLTQPTTAYFGQKDYQQFRIIQQLVRDLELPLRVRVLPTVREPDGLAMSSRNAYLSPAERAQAAAIARALRTVRARIRAGTRDAAAIARVLRSTLREAGIARIDYAVAADAVTLAPVRRLRGRVILLLAARVGRTRLIDNLLVEVS